VSRNNPGYKQTVWMEGSSVCMIDQRDLPHREAVLRLAAYPDTIRAIRDMAVRGRPLEEILDQYLHTVHPMHLQFVEPSRRYADVVIPRGGENTVAIDLLIATVTRRLAGSPA